MKIILAIAAIISAASAASFNNRIVGGHIAKDGQFPYQASLRYQGSHICGGSIIDDEWILTAGHCVHNFNASLMSVVVGTNTLNHGGVTHQVLKHIHHEDYSSDADTAINDIAIVKLKTKIIFNEKVQTVPQNINIIHSGADLLLSGWGIESYPSSTPSNVLKFLNLKALDTEECQERFKELGYEVNEYQLCAFSRNGEGACSGDSGSPLVYKGSVAGIASWVEPCGIGYPDVYTKVSMYNGWIQRTIGDNMDL